MKRLNLIIEAEAKRVVTKNILETLEEVAVTSGTKSEFLVEAITHVLRNISNAVKNRNPINVMNADSLANFLAGVEVLASGLPEAKNEKKKALAVRLLKNIQIGSDGLVTTQAAPIASLGSNYSSIVAKYRDLIQEYLKGIKTGETKNTNLENAVNKLSYAIDQAMRNVEAENF